MKSPFFRLLFFVFLAAFFYDDPQLFLWKRIFYSVFLYLSIWQLITLYCTIYSSGDSFPLAFKIYSFLYIFFIGINLIVSLLSPKLNIVTLINNPYALLSAVPVFAFGIGYFSQKEDIINILRICCIAFTICFFIPSFSSPLYYAGYVCSSAIIPAFIFSIESKKGQLQHALLLILACIFSTISNYRIILFKVLLFATLYVVLNVLVKKAFLKFLFISATIFFIIQFVTNFENFLHFFQIIFNLKGFDTTDTRSFLYEEFFGNLKGSELIFGRGFLGSYFSEYFLELQLLHHNYADSFDRFSIEVGFLELILKGGFIYVLFFYLPLLYTSLKSLLSVTNDRLTYSLGIYILVEVLCMFIENIPLYNFEFFLLFFLAGFLFRKLNQYKYMSSVTMYHAKPAVADFGF